MSDRTDSTANEIAVIGMALRLPGAATPVSFWDNLCHGVESISDLSLDQLRAAGVPAALLEHPAYVRRKPLLTGVADFATLDTQLFRFSPREAQLTGPEQRLLLECAWEALEAAAIGAPPAGVRGGAFVSADLSRYLLRNLLPAMTPRTLATVMDQAMFGNDAEHTALRLAHRLDLTGPAFALGATCASSLLAVHLACQSLLDFECDFAVAGGASVEVPHEVGYLYREGGLGSIDGHCRAFSARASGTVFGSGVGVVVLKRLADAVAEGHPIWATVRGSAVNNDGGKKQSYTAPSADGQAQAIAEAMARAAVEPAEIGVVEAQGTATSLGDSIEVAALHQAFGAQTRGPGSCALGSVKTNIGHAGGAAGIAAFIKAVLMVHHGRVPPSLHGEPPNLALDLSRGPFFVVGGDSPWPHPGGPRLAGVSAFGVGGTNVHVVVGEAPSPVSTPTAARAPAPHRLLWSAASGPALEAQRAQLAAHLSAHPDLDLGDLAWTLQVGRRALALRDGLVCRDRDEALALLRHAGQRRETQAADAELGRWLRGEALPAPPPGTQRLVLPTYPFSRQRHWLEPPAPGAAATTPAAPETLEGIIAEAAMAVLGFVAEEIAPDTDLIEWGIDSFLAAELIQSLHQRLGVTVPMAMLHEHRTIANLAAALRAADVPALGQGRPARFDFVWVEDRDTLAAIHRRMTALSPEELAVIEPLFDRGALVSFERLHERWRDGRLVVLCARPIASDEIAGLYLLDRRESLHLINARGVSRLDDLFVSYSFLAPERRGSLDVSALDRWFDEEVSLRWQPAPADIANTVRFRTPVCHKHGRILAAALATRPTGPDSEEQLFTRIYFQNFDAKADLTRLAEDKRAEARLLALMRSQDYDGVPGAELLALVDEPTTRVFARLNFLIPADARPRLRDAQRRVERGELIFAGFELRWLEPLFLWRRPG